MTATERLRELLDERGIVWGIADYSRRRLMTVWHVDGQKWQFFEDRKTGWTHLSCRMDYLTTEQAIEATLSSCNCTNGERTNGTCHITDNGPWGYPYVCSACGASFDPDVNGGEFNYCPNCGRKVVP